MESNLNYGTLLLELDITALFTRANSQTGALDPHSSDMHPILGEGGEGGRSADGQYRFSLVVPLHTHCQHKHLHTNWQPLLFTNWWVAAVPLRIQLTTMSRSCLGSLCTENEF